MGAQQFLGVGLGAAGFGQRVDARRHLRAAAFFKQVARAALALLPVALLMS